MADDATVGLPETAKGLLPFIALAIDRGDTEEVALRFGLLRALDIRRGRSGVAVG
jgi:hypothetical protein